MPIQFRCPTCERVLSTASRKIGMLVHCPACQTPVPVERAEPELQLPPEPRLPPLLAPRHSISEAGLGRQAPWLLAVMILVITLVTWLGLNTGGRTPDVPPDIVAQAPAPAEAVPPTPAREPAPAIAKSEETIPAPPVVEQKAPVELAGPSEPPPPAVVEQPVVAATPPTQTPAPAKTSGFKRRQPLDDEGLRKQLVAMTEVGLDLRTAGNFLNFTRSNRGGDGAAFLLKQRPDLVSLPMRMGADCHLGKEPAEHLKILSRKLRSYVDASVPKDGVEVRPDAERLRALLLMETTSSSFRNANRTAPNLVSTGTREWLVPEAIPALQQLLMAENKSVRLLLVDLLAQIKGPEATVALAQRALYDLAGEVREAAVDALRSRPLAEARPTLVSGLRYPWPAVADHAAEALVNLNDLQAVALLVTLLEEPDPRLPGLQQRGRELPFGPDLSQAPDGLKRSTPNSIPVVKEVVRINHLSNCLLCHAPSLDQKDDVRGRVPLPNQVLPNPSSTPQYYEGTAGIFVRADITYLKQDFSVHQPVANAGVWPNYQRFDYLVRQRMPSIPELAAFARHKEAVKAGQTPSYPQREAVLFALRHLTGQDAGSTSTAWEGIPKALD